MPKNLEQIVQSMIDSGEDEDAIAGVIKEYKQTNPVNAPSEAGTFGEGFKKSLLGGEALNAGLEGAKGYLKGAVADLPSGFMGGLKSIGDALYKGANRTPAEWASMGEGMFDTAKGMLNTTAKAGSDPAAFGEMMGQITGQPLATEGLIKSPNLRYPVGRAIETTGRIMREHQPISGTIPRVAEPRVLRTAERGLGGMIERGGQRLRRPPAAAEAPKSVDLDIKDGKFIDSGFKEGVYTDRVSPSKGLPSATSRQHANPARKALPPALDSEKGSIVGVRAVPDVYEGGPIEVGPSQMPNTRSGNSRLSTAGLRDRGRVYGRSAREMPELPELFGNTDAATDISGMPLDQLNAGGNRTPQLRDAYNEIAGLRDSLRRSSARHMQLFGGY